MKQGAREGVAARMTTDRISRALVRAGSAVALFLSMTSAGPGLAAPLTLGEIGAETDLSAAPQLVLCPSERSTGGERCRLARQSIGGMAIRDSIVELNAAGRPRDIQIVIAGEDHDLARDLLTGRFGAPSRVGPTIAWLGFDGKAGLTLSHTGTDAVIAWRFPENAVASASAPGTAGGDKWNGERPLVYLLAFAVLGLIVGGVLSRLRRRERPRRPARAAPETSMRATLERRMRDGKGLEF